MITKRKAVVLISVLLLVFILVPFFVIKKTFDIKSGWNSILWGSSQNQVKEWVKKNNTNYIYSLCNSSHFGVVCYKLSWKNKESSLFEYIEFQFKDDSLCAVIETEKQSLSDPAKKYSLGRPLYGKDIRLFYKRENGIKYSYVVRLFYYDIQNKWKNTKNRYYIKCVIRNIPSNSSFSDEIISYQYIKGYYSANYFDLIKNNSDYDYLISE